MISHGRFIDVIGFVLKGQVVKILGQIVKINFLTVVF